MSWLMRSVMVRDMNAAVTGRWETHLKLMVPVKASKDSEASDFGAALTPELRAREERLRNTSAAKK